MRDTVHSAPTEGGGVQSVDRAVTVLETLARAGEAGVSDVAATLGVHKSTAFRLLGALAARGLVEQTQDRGKYRLGMGLLRLAATIPGRLDVVRQAREVCADLARELGETVNLAVLRSHYAVNLDQALGAAAVSTQNWVGQLTPLHATASGKVLLAFASPDRLDALLAASGLPAFTPRTLTDRAALHRELAGVREAGFARTSQEYEDGLNALGAPVRDHTGEVVAAISVSGPAYRFTEDAMAAAVPSMLAGARGISERLGYLR